MITTGNSRATDKWRPILDYDIEPFQKCNEPIKWSEITISLKDIPNNKSPGTDGIPNEIWEMFSNEILPTSKIAKIVFKNNMGYRQNHRNNFKQHSGSRI
ncbi:hypothetical protein AYI68_g4312 [Smittium mucronatum]|uniref:Uncharacterized protein n=1 Tax=Smittium mucronatum TaxID=133383 RepID=A0A1R0GXF7_9FUNG|nr:hypothetical protein AYI68_g4312 [Smittium mucronatum]